MGKVLVSFLEDLKFFILIFFKPRKLFDHIKINPKPFIPVLIFSALMILTFLMILSFFQKKPPTNSREIKIIFFSVLAGIFYLFTIFLKSSVISIGIKLLRGYFDFDLLFIAFVYCMTPYLIAFTVYLLFPIPSFSIINIFLNVLAITLARFYEVILSIIAISTLSNFSYWKSFLVFLPWLIVWFFIGV